MAYAQHLAQRILEELVEIVYIISQPRIGKKGMSQPPPLTFCDLESSAQVDDHQRLAQQ